MDGPDFDYATRRGRLYGRIGSDPIDGYYTDCLSHLRYLTGFRGTAGSLLATDGETVLFLDGRYRNYGEELETTDLEVCLVESDRLDDLSREAQKRSLNGIHFERSNLGYDTFRSVVQKVDVEDRRYGEDWIAKLRTQKDASERDAHLEAIRRTLDLFPIIETWLEPGLTEGDLSRSIRRELESRSEGLAFQPLVLIGERTANPHSPTSDRTLEPGEPLLVDMGLKVNGYCSDLTRMFFLGDGDHPSRELYELSKRSAARAFEGMEAGMALSRVAERAHDLIRDEGHEEHLRHGLGHGVGLDVHEAPRLSEKSEGVLEPGMVVTLEPGIYIDGEGGGRIEHMVYVTEDGPRLLDEPNNRMN